jgi:hypothetical protein
MRSRRAACRPTSPCPGDHEHATKGLVIGMAATSAAVTNEELPREPLPGVARAHKKG